MGVNRSPTTNFRPRAPQEVNLAMQLPTTAITFGTFITEYSFSVLQTGWESDHANRRRISRHRWFHKNTQGPCGRSRAQQRNKPRAVSADGRLCAVQPRQNSVNNVGLSSWKSGISVCCLLLITPVSEESSCQSLQAARRYHNTTFSLRLCLHLS